MCLQLLDSVRIHQTANNALPEMNKKHILNLPFKIEKRADKVHNVALRLQELADWMTTG